MLRNRLYYLIKPWVPHALRIAIRSSFARRKRDRVLDRWPILPGSEKPPEGWPGWPNGKQFAFILTHDVEGESGVAKCRKLMELEMKYGFRSSFNFIPEGEYRVSRELREELRSNGFEIGVHDLHHDGKLYSSRDEFAQRAARINDYLKDWGAVGFRSGFMLHNLEWLHDLNVEYEASTFDTDPFEPQPDGEGTIFPFWVPRQGSSGLGVALNGETRDGYVELPYTLPQDSTLFLLLRDPRPDVWCRKLDWLAKQGGMALVNVHPDYLRFEGEVNSRVTFPAQIYGDFLRYARESYDSIMWHALPRDAANYFKSAIFQPAEQGAIAANP